MEAAEVEKQFERFERILTDLIGIVGASNSKLSKGFERVENRLNLVERKMTSVEKSLTSVEKRLTSVEKRMTSVEKRMTLIESNLYPLNRLEKRQDLISAKLDSLAADVAIIQENR